MPIEQQEEAAARGVGKRRQMVEDGWGPAAYRHRLISVNPDERILPPPAAVKREVAQSVEPGEIENGPGGFLPVEHDTDHSGGLSNPVRWQAGLNHRADERSDHFLAGSSEGRRILGAQLRVNLRERSSSARCDANGQDIGGRCYIGVQRGETYRRFEYDKTSRGTEGLFGQPQTSRKQPVAAKDMLFGREHQSPGLGDDLDLRDGGNGEGCHRPAG